MAVCRVLVVVGQLERGLRVRGGVWGFGLVPALWYVPAVGHGDIIVVVWRGDCGGLIQHLVHALCELGVSSGGWELVPPGDRVGPYGRSSCCRAMWWPVGARAASHA
jgi:hypothetical protein